jgi:folate-binding protein YgfZ
MNEGRSAELTRRSAVAVGGPDAGRFLNDLITADIARTTSGQAIYAALLTPQGKILFDFIVFRDGERFVFDLLRSVAADFVKRLGFYRLRARVTIEDLSSSHRVLALWNDAGFQHFDGIAAPDPRLAALGWRMVLEKDAQPPAGFTPASEAEYDARRIRLGVPEGGIDFAFGDAFPHDADMDQLGGVDFGKGCYIGQEVVSRMEHRGTARRRFVLASADAPLPASGSAVNAGDRALGVLGSSSGMAGLALIRLDRAKQAIDAGTTVVAEGTPLRLAIPGWAKFGWPAEVAAD